MNLASNLNDYSTVRLPDSLTLGLSEYGLCPDDWSIVNEGPLTYRIENIHEPDFFFVGTVKVENGKKRWNTIRLAGI